MTQKNDKQNAPGLKALTVQNHDLNQPLVQWLLQEVLEQEMTDSLGAAKGNRGEAIPVKGDFAKGQTFTVMFRGKRI
jgi:transposase-like protein